MSDGDRYRDIDLDRFLESGSGRYPDDGPGRRRDDEPERFGSRRREREPVERPKPRPRSRRPQQARSKKDPRRRWLALAALVVLVFVVIVVGAQGRTSGTESEARETTPFSILPLTPEYLSGSGNGEDLQTTESEDAGPVDSTTTPDAAAEDVSGAASEESASSLQ